MNRYVTAEAKLPLCDTFEKTLLMMLRRSDAGGKNVKTFEVFPQNDVTFCCPLKFKFEWYPLDMKWSYVLLKCIRNFASFTCYSNVTGNR